MSARRADHHVKCADGVRLRVRTVEPENPRATVVLVHGVAAPLVPTYDLGVDGYSFMERLALHGLRAVAFDHRNFGDSDRGPALQRAPEPGAAHSLDDSVEDIRAVVADTCARSGVAKVTLFGSSRGAIQALAAAAAHPAQLELAILNNPSSLCYLAGQRDGPLADELRAERTRMTRPETYARYTAEHQRQRWKKLFGDETSVEHALQETYIKACIDTDPEGAAKSPPHFRVPSEGFPDRVPLVPLEQLAVPVLVIEGESIPQAHVDAFIASAPKGRARVLEIHGSDHFTLRNARRFELANMVDTAITALRWGRS